MNYLEFDFKIKPLQPASDIFIAELSEIGFESFVENPDGLTAYIIQEAFSQEHFDGIQLFENELFEISYSKSIIAQQNWNAQWEQNFRPIQVDEECIIRAPFHEKKKVTYDIIIEPKMSFGTGHHETTKMMLKHIMNNDFKSKSVLDMGCGTGVLAILAKKCGAKNVEAIDIDPWCYENTLENIERNNCDDIVAKLGDIHLLAENTYDIILANINLNVLLKDIKRYSESLKKNGLIFMSGFLAGDLDGLSEAAQNAGFNFLGVEQMQEWTSAVYRKS